MKYVRLFILFWLIALQGSPIQAITFSDVPLSEAAADWDNDAAGDNITFDLRQGTNSIGTDTVAATQEASGVWTATPTINATGYWGAVQLVALDENGKLAGVGNYRVFGDSLEYENQHRYIGSVTGLSSQTAFSISNVGTIGDGVLVGSRIRIINDSDQDAVSVGLITANTAAALTVSWDASNPGFTIANGDRVIIEAPGSVGGYVANRLTSAATATSFENELRTGGRQGRAELSTTISSGSSTTWVLADGVNLNDYYNGHLITVFSGSELSRGETKIITDYVGSTKTITIGSTFSTISPTASDICYIHRNMGVGSIEADAIEAGDFATGAIDADATASDYLAEINVEADTALADIHLDHLLAVDYDPASKPGTSTALLNEIFEDDLGVSRFTVNALENGPSGSFPTVGDIADAVWDEATAGHVTVGTFGVATTDILTDTSVIGAAGAGLTAIPWNAAWDAEVQSEVDDSLIFYKLDHLVAVADADDPVDNSIIAKLVSSAVTADWSGFVNTTDSLQGLRDNLSTHSAADVWAAATRTLTAGTNIDGSTFTAIPWNAAWDAEVQSEALDALQDLELQYLFSSAYDPATKPGVATAWANVIVENDGGVPRFTTNSLELAPTGSGASAAAIADAVWDEAASGHVAVGSFGVQLGTDVDAILVDTAEIGAAGAGLTAVPWNVAWDAEVQSEANDALVDLGLDHLVSASVAGTDITDNSIIAKLVSSSATADWDSYVNTTDALQAIRDNGDSAWITATGFSTLDAAGVRTALGMASANFDTQVGGIQTDVTSILDDTGTSGVVLVNAGITGAKFDASTAFPLTSVDTGSTRIARTGADSDTLETLSDQIDALGLGGAVHSTTVATAPTTTTYTVTAGSADDNAYNDMFVLFIDQTTATQISKRRVTDYTGSTGLVTIDSAPDFTVLVGDTVKFYLSDSASSPTISGGGLNFKGFVDSFDPAAPTPEIIQGAQKQLTVIVEATGTFADSTPTSITAIVEDVDGNEVTKTNAEITRVTEDANYQIVRFTLSTSDTASLSRGLANIQIAFDSELVQIPRAVRVRPGL